MSERPDTLTEAHVVSHLLFATDALTEWHTTGTDVAGCGELVSATGMSGIRGKGP